MTTSSPCMRYMVWTHRADQVTPSTYACTETPYSLCQSQLIKHGGCRRRKKRTCKLYTEFLRDAKFYTGGSFRLISCFFLVENPADLVSFDLFLYVDLGLCCVGFDWRGWRCWTIWCWVGFLDLSSKYSADDEGEEHCHIEYRI
jgi:hypothetical protein